MAGGVAVFVESADPVLNAGVTAQLRARPLMRVTDDVDSADVAVVVADEIDDPTLRVLRAIHHSGLAKIAVVVTHIDEHSLLSAVQSGGCAFMRRSDCTPDNIARLVQRAADGTGSIPDDLLGGLLSQVSQLHVTVLKPRGITLSGFSEREIDVLRLVAEGKDTAEISRLLSYSERTVKAIIHEVTTRFQLKNRAQAVAYAARNGLI
jgi:DNA-binding NarL/FixJ family response regulator